MVLNIFHQTDCFKSVELKLFDDVFLDEIEQDLDEKRGIVYIVFIKKLPNEWISLYEDEFCLDKSISIHEDLEFIDKVHMNESEEASSIDWKRFRDQDGNNKLSTHISLKPDTVVLDSETDFYNENCESSSEELADNRMSARADQCFGGVNI